MMQEPIRVGGVETFSTVDFPEKICATIFMQGCPWRCPFCHNAMLQNINVDNGFVWSKFVEFLKTRTKLLDAVVFSGGEPLVQNGLETAIKQVKDLGFKIGLHTGGYRPEHLEKIMPLLDWVGFDIKAPFDIEKYGNAIGINAETQLSAVLKSLDMLLASGIDFECRTTCDPRILSIKDIDDIADFLAEKGVKKYFLQKYRPIPSDTQTSDSDCEKFFTDKEFLSSLKQKFEIFAVRK